MVRKDFLEDILSKLTLKIQAEKKKKIQAKNFKILYALYRKKDICFTYLYNEANKRTKVVRTRRKAWKKVSTSRTGVVSLF